MPNMSRSTTVRHSWPSTARSLSVRRSWHLPMQQTPYGSFALSTAGHSIEANSTTSSQTHQWAEAHCEFGSSVALPLAGNPPSTISDEAKTEKTIDDDSSGSDDDGMEYPSGLRLCMIVIALVLSIFLSALDMTIVSTAIPRITDQFHSLDQVGWYGSAFFLTLGAFQGVWGKAFKYFPLKTSFLISMFIFEVGSLICAVANSSMTLIIGRAIAGAGAAGISSGAYTIIAFTAPPSTRPAYTGILGAVFGLAAVVGPLLGGVFTDNLSWRWCFYINLPIGAVAAAVTLFFFRTPTAAKPQPATMKEKLLQLDIPGTAIILSAMVCYLLAMQWGGVTKPWSDGNVIACLVCFGVLLIAFGVVEYISGDRALLQTRLVKDRTIGVMCAYIFIVAGIFFILLYYLPVYFQVTRNVSASQSGIRNLPLVLGASIFSIVSGVWLTATGQYIPLMMFGGTVASVACGLMYTFDIDSSSSKWIGYQAMAGIGLGLIYQVAFIVAQSIVEVSDLSSVSAMILFFQTVGGSIWISAGQASFVNRLLQRLPETAPGIDPKLVVATGATALRKVFTPEQMPGILAAYMDGLRVPFILCIACAGASTLLCLAPRWESIKGRIPAGAGAA